ncbi:response regulator [Candidatus Sumerlaeota bacterium]|nr:response regulator [Candidatus Sumerlaeota bacterium]
MGCAKIIVITRECVAERLYRSALDEKYDVEIITHPENAIEEVIEHPPDMLIIDLQVSGVDGVELVERLKGSEQLKKTLFLVTADFETDETLPDSFWRKHLGVNAFLSRPLTPERLRQTVERIFLDEVRPQEIIGPGFF